MERTNRSSLQKEIGHVIHRDVIFALLFILVSSLSHIIHNLLKASGRQHLWIFVLHTPFRSPCIEVERPLSTVPIVF